MPVTLTIVSFLVEPFLSLACFVGEELRPGVEIELLTLVCVLVV